MKQAIRKALNRSNWTNLNKSIRLEVDGKTIALPSIEGIIILNILRYVSTSDSLQSSLKQYLLLLTQMHLL